MMGVVGRPVTTRHLEYVRIVYHKGLFEQKGAQSELARMFGVSRQYIYQLIQRVKTEGSVLDGEVSAEPRSDNGN